MAKGSAFMIAVSMALILGKEALAQSAESQSTRVDDMVRRAKALEVEGKYDEAAKLFAESYALNPRPGELLNLAYCYEKVGRFASAWQTWLRGADAADASGDSDRAAAARDHAKDIASKVLYAVVTVAPQARGTAVEVTVDGAPLLSERWGRPIPVDPGEHQVAAAGRVLRTWSSRFVASPTEPPSVAVPELVPIPVSAPASPQRASSVLRPVAWTVGGAGLAALGVGAAFGIAGLVNKDGSTQNRNCVDYAGSNNCNAAGNADLASAHRDFEGADVGYAIGAGLLLTGAVLWMVSRPTSTKPATATVTIEPNLARDLRTISISARW